MMWTSEMNTAASDYHTEISSLRAERDTLRAERDNLREQLNYFTAPVLGSQLPPEWAISKTEEKILLVLYRRHGLVSKHALYFAVYGEESDVLSKVIEVHLCHIRRKLKPFGIEILTTHGCGFALPEESYAKLSPHVTGQAA